MYLTIFGCQITKKLKKEPLTWQENQNAKVKTHLMIGMKTIIFDLDETLIHCNENLNMGHQVQLPITFPTGDIVQAGINIRPGAKDILKYLAEKF